MKQSCIRYAKLLSIYLVTCLLCSLIFSVFYYFHIINVSIYSWGNFICSTIVAIGIATYLTKKIEKKALLSVLIFIATLWAISLCAMPFLSISILKASLRSLIVLLFAFILLIRK